MSRGVIAFIDDEPDLCAAAEDWLSASGFSVLTFTDPVTAAAQLDHSLVDAVVTDLRMPGLMGDELMRQIKHQDTDLPVILISAHADISAAVAAMRSGAHDFLEKPYLPEHLVAVLDRAVEWRRLRRDLARAQSPQSKMDRVEQQLIGRSPITAALRHAVLQLADTPVDLLIRGPIGSGREALARLIHDVSRRARKPFVALDCKAIGEEDLAAELFGYERGAFSSRSGERASRFEFAQGGTIYLTEIDALSSSLQMRLFRTLNERAVTRSGGHVARPVDIRLMAATSTDLEAERDAGRFRQDLFFRLASAGLRAPSLSERREDLAQLYLHYLQQSAARLRRPVPDPLPAELERLRQSDWPGNLAQLQAEAERHVLGLPRGAATPVSARAPQSAEGQNLAQKVAAYEALLIQEALTAHGGSQAAAAERLGLPRRTLNEKIARLGLKQSG